MASGHLALQCLLGSIVIDLRIWSNLSLHPAQSRKLMTLIADCSGRAWNHTTAANHLGEDVKTIQRYVDVLDAAYLIRLLPPFETKGCLKPSAKSSPRPTRKNDHRRHRAPEGR